MEAFVAKIEQHWKIVSATVFAIFWVGRLSWRVVKLEEANANKTPLVSVTSCKAIRGSCSELVQVEIAHVISLIELYHEADKERYKEIKLQIDCLVEHMLNNPKAKN